MNAHSLVLLQMVRDDQDVGGLRRRGLEYFQIAKLIQKAINDGFLQLSQKTLTVTEEGKRALARAKHADGFSESGGWILPDDDSRIDQLDPTDIYLPRPAWKRE